MKTEEKTEVIEAQDAACNVRALFLHTRGPLFYLQYFQNDEIIKGMMHPQPRNTKD